MKFCVSTQNHGQISNLTECQIWTKIDAFYKNFKLTQCPNSKYGPFGGYIENLFLTQNVVWEKVWQKRSSKFGATWVVEALDSATSNPQMK